MKSALSGILSRSDIKASQTSRFWSIPRFRLLLFDLSFLVSSDSASASALLLARAALLRPLDLPDLSQYQSVIVMSRQSASFMS